MKLWITVEKQILTLTHTLLVCLGLLDHNGELAPNAPFLCCEASLPAEISSPHPEQAYRF